MSLIRPSLQENIITTLFMLEPDRPMYYMHVVTLGKRLFMSLGQENLVAQLDELILEKVERPLMSPFVSVIHAFYDFKFINSKRAYCKIGDSIDYRTVTRYEIMMSLEAVKEWIYDKATELSPYIRFTKSSMMFS